MPKILAIETATEACSATLISQEHNATNAACKEVSRFKLAPREHTKLILPMVEEVLEVGGCTMNDLDAIAFGRGPGAFTGLRIAAGVTQGLALSIDKPVMPISTLSALALQASQNNNYNGETILAGLDARMGEVYWGAFKYSDTQLILLGDEKVGKMDEVVDYLQHSDNKTFVAIGSAWDAYPFKNSTRMPSQTLTVINDAFPSAAEIAKLAMSDYFANKTVSIEAAQPVYIRNNVAVKSKKS